MKMVLLSICFLFSCTMLTQNKNNDNVAAVPNLVIQKPFYEVDKKSLEEICESKNYQGCYQLGIYFLDNEKNETEAIKKFQFACDNKIGLACYQVGMLNFEEKDPNVLYNKEDFKASINYFEKACELKEYFSCVLVSKNIMRELKKSEDSEFLEKQLLRVASLIEEACAHNMTTACNIMAHKNFDYPDFIRDSAKDMCTAGIVQSCFVQK